MKGAEPLAGAAFSTAARLGADRTVVQLVRTTVEDTVVGADSAPGHARSDRFEIAVRVHRDGAVGVADGPLLDRHSVLDLTERAAELARASGAGRSVRPAQRPAPGNPQERVYRSPVAIDPFSLSPGERAEPLREARARALAVAGCTHAVVRASAYRRESMLLSSDGDRHHLESTQTGGWLTAAADGPSGPATRSYPDRTGRHDMGGWEHVHGLDLPGGAERAAREAVLLSRAKPCPSGTGPAVIDSSQLTLQIHESIGHPLELDRILGWELDYAGGSFVGLTDVGHLAYASDQVTVVADPVSGRGVGSMPWDDEGTPTAVTPLIDRGLLVGLLSSTTSTAAAGLPSAPGSARTEGAGLPLVRMTNINLQPGSGSLGDLLSDMGDGLLISGNQSFSIDDDRDRFHFSCELAWRVRGGRLVEPLRAPRYHGRTLDFWRSCQRVAGAEEWAMHSVTFCMKGNPIQTARVGHGAAPALFSEVSYGSWE
ncbi:TldD/PmbA family protein [Streptomyces caelestis]|uniref:CcbIH n=1 Tax=Streptomyces caelestis TaxID=36816 RepID=E9JER9_9ACTN|nr:TldD/PmbA family protein [Streptomyces caelestis]ADB92557.1 CcbIH [Streptomyces caelestis]MBB5794798.1 TldD protein [Streptomyces caelestis]GGW28133.1 peptidase C69 [Streptomyces caelestis]